MKCCEKCTNYKPKKLGRWQKIWEVCYDFDNGEGAFPIWMCLFFPIVVPMIYLVYYYSGRKRISR